MEIWGENGNREASHRRNYTDRQHLRLLLLNKECFRLISEKVSRILSQKLIFAAKRKLLVFVLCWLWLGAVLISFIRCRNCLSKWVVEGEKMLLQPVVFEEDWGGEGGGVHNSWKKFLLVQAKEEEEESSQFVFPCICHSIQFKCSSS